MQNTLFCMSFLRFLLSDLPYKRSVYKAILFRPIFPFSIIKCDFISNKAFFSKSYIHLCRNLKQK